MKSILFIAFLVIAACNGQSKWTTSESNEKPSYSEYQLKVKNYQDSVSNLFMSGMNGVMPKEEVSSTKRLPYFEPNEDYRVKATWERIENGKVFKMPTSTDRLPEYKAVGKLKFQLDNKDLELTLYQNLEYPEGLFCPFKDLTNGKESYGAGRYLDFQWQDTLNPIIDFNYCYNPYCAYNSQYSCPIPPAENHLNVRIEAGVMKWH